MAELISDEAQDYLQDNILNIDNLESDNDGQLLIFTGIYRWKDGSYHDEAEFQ